VAHTLILRSIYLSRKDKAVMNGTVPDTVMSGPPVLLQRLRCLKKLFLLAVFILVNPLKMSETG